MAGAGAAAERAFCRLRSCGGTSSKGRGCIYPSFESRAEIAALVEDLDRHGGWPRDPDGVPIYPGRARKLSAAERKRRRDAGEPFALRLAMDAAVARAGVLNWSETGSGPHGQTGLVTAAPQRWGDVVLARKDMPTSYHISAVLDDALQGVTDVVRGQDLFWSTSIHRLLQALLGLPEPVYHHHKLILDEEGRKLAKSTQSTGLRELRAGGATPARYQAHGRAWPLIRLGHVKRGWPSATSPLIARLPFCARGICTQGRPEGPPPEAVRFAHP